MNRKTITHHELTLDVKTTARNDATPPQTSISILDIFTHLKQWGYDTKNRNFGVNQTCYGSIPEIKIDTTNNRIDILFCLSDKDAEAPEAFDLTKRSIRTFNKTKDEGFNSRCHMVIKIDPNNKRQAKFALEYKQNMSVKFCIDTLNYFLRNAKKTYPNYFVGIHPTARCSNGNPKPIKFKTEFKYETAISDEFVRAFEDGKIQDVSFLEPVSNQKTFDPNGHYTPSKKEVHLRVGANIIQKSSTTIGQKINDIKASFDSIIKRHPKLKDLTFTIKYKDDDDKQRTAYYDSSMLDFTLAHKTYATCSTKNPSQLNINQDLCDIIFRHIR